MIGIFRTNICTVQDKNAVVSAISTHFNIAACSVDIEDCDRVLRVVGPQMMGEQAIIDFVKTLGFRCDTLD